VDVTKLIPEYKKWRAKGHPASCAYIWAKAELLKAAKLVMFGHSVEWGGLGCADPVIDGFEVRISQWSETDWDPFEGIVECIQGIRLDDAPREKPDHFKVASKMYRDLQFYDRVEDNRKSGCSRGVAYYNALQSKKETARWTANLIGGATTYSYAIVACDEVDFWECTSSFDDGEEIEEEVRNLLHSLSRLISARRSK